MGVGAFTRVGFFKKGEKSKPPSALQSLEKLIHPLMAEQVMKMARAAPIRGPDRLSVEERAAIEVPALVLAHGNDLIHPFDDAAKLAAELPHAQLVRARSPIELRWRPDRLTFGELDVVR